MAWNVTGSLVALVTPFAADGSVDFDALGALIDFHLANHTDGLVVLGTTGESSTMTHEEDAAVCDYTVKRVAGRIPVIAGSGSNSTETMLEKSIMFENLGADGLLLITPYYNKANAEGIYRHFATVADAVRIPCILYNVPGRTGCSIPLPVLARLAQHPNVVGIKEASGDISYATEVAKLLCDNFCMYSGNDDIILPLLSLGGAGVISVLANVCPAQTHELVAAYHAGDIARAREIQLSYLELIHALFIEVNPIPVKTALQMMGKAVGGFRLPLCEMTAEHAETLRNALTKAGVL